jgi:hypothetical protein
MSEKGSEDDPFYVVAAFLDADGVAVPLNELRESDALEDFRINMQTRSVDLQFHLSGPSQCIFMPAE